jgi:hypothetical protein
MENRFVKLDMTEVTRAVHLSAHARLTDAVHIHRSQAIVVNTFRFGISVVLVDNPIIDDGD